ncbi:FliH/SctL family protein [Bdellovibrionota bacterium FG-1]
MSKMGKEPFQRMKITEEPGKSPRDIRVVKMAETERTVAQSFEMNQLYRSTDGNYGAIKAKFGPLAVTDVERGDRTQRDRRFAINPLTKKPLSIEAEELRVLEEMVSARVAILAEEGRARGYGDGFTDGLEVGRQEAIKNFREEAGERREKFEALLNGFETAKVEIFKANERFLMDLLFRMAKMVTLKEIRTDRTFIARLCKELIEKIGLRENVRIRIHPDDAITAEMLKPELEQAIGELKNLTVEKSEAVQSGGCIVETEWATIDASLEIQFQGIREALMGAPEA